MIAHASVRRVGVLGAVLVGALVAGCVGDAAVTAPPATATPASTAPGPARTPLDLTIYAAASLTTAMDRVKSAYEAANPNVTLVVSTDSSAALEAKIEQGAPADVFLSADTTNAAKLQAAGVAAGDPVRFAGNSLVIVVPLDNPAGIRSPFDLARAGVGIIAAGDAVPITRYALQVIANLAALPTAPAAFDTAYAANVVSKEDNVRAVVAKVELGEGDAAIVYQTDAFASGRVEAIEITPTTANVPAIYAGIVVNSSAHPSEAAAFLAWIAGPDGQAILGTFGFLPPPG